MNGTKSWPRWCGFGQSALVAIAVFNYWRTNPANAQEKA